MEKKEVLKISLGILIIILFLTLFIGFSILKNKENINKKNYMEDNHIKEINESYVIRSFSSQTVALGNLVDVTLDVYVNVNLETNDNGYAFAIAYENTSYLVADGWNVVKDASGSLGSSDDLGWIFFTTNPYQPLNSHYQIKYTMRAPTTTGIYNFIGNYIFSNSTSSAGETTLGEKTLTVI